MDMNGSKVGSNFVAKFDKDTDAILTNENKLIILGQCIGDPNVSCIDSDLFAVGCQLIRKDVLSGDNVYKNVGTIDTPNWILGGSSSSINWGDINGTLSNQTDLQNALNNKADKNGTPKLFRYFNNAGVDSSDPLASRDSVTNYTELAREYDAIVQDLQFTGTGSNDLTINSITVQRPYTFTIDSQNNYAGLYFQGAGLNDASVDYAAYAGQRPMYFTFGIEAANDESSTGNGGFAGTPINGETFTTGSGATFKFISYDSGTDTIYAYNVSTSPAPAPTDVFLGTQSGATITLVNTFTAGTNEVGAWGDSVGNDGVWSIQPTVAYTIGVGADSLDVTFPGGGHTVSDFWSTYFVQGAVLMNLLSPSGPFTIGETITQASNPGASAVVGFDNGGNIALINIVGQLNLGASSGLITGSTSGQTATLNTFSSYADTFTWTDGTTTENQVVITTGSQILDSGNITIQFGSNAAHPVGDQWQLTFPNVNIETGYETQQIVFPNVPFPLEGSTIYAKDVNGKVAIGTFDLTPFGQDSKTAGIVSLYTDGSQSTFTESKGFANLNLFDTTTNKSMNVNYSGDTFQVQGYNGSSGFGININANNATYQTNSTTFTLPNQVNGAGYVVTDVNGNGVLTLEPAAGGTVNPVNGTINIGPDIGLGGNLIQDTVILTNSFNINIHGNDAAGNDTGIVYFTNSLNGLTGYAGSYSNIAGYNKSGVYTTGLNQHLAVLGFYDGTGSLNNASYTIHEHNMNTAESKKYTRLCESNSNLSIYSDTVEVDGLYIKHMENYTNSNIFSPSNGFIVIKDVDLSIPNKIQLIKSQDTLNSRFVEEIHDISSNIHKKFTVSDTSNVQIFKITTTDIETDKYQSTRDDSSINYPTNFLYTDGFGKLQSAPLGKGTYSLPAYADDTTAGGAGLTAGKFYQTDGTGAAPLNVAGIVMIKQ